MTKVFADISMSLDGFVAGPNPSLDAPLGEGGERLHEWALALKSFRSRHGMPGGETNRDSEVLEETVANTGASIMGRRMFSGGAGPWEEDPNSRGWWGDDPPFGHPVFVLTSHAREPLAMEGGTTFTFVTAGIDAALDQARAAAGDADVQVDGGGRAVSQFLKAGLLEEIQVHVVPVFLGSGTRLFEGHVADAPRHLELTRTLASPTGVLHARYAASR